MEHRPHFMMPGLEHQPGILLVLQLLLDVMTNHFTTQTVIILIRQELDMLGLHTHQLLLAAMVQTTTFHRITHLRAPWLLITQVQADLWSRVQAHINLLLQVQVPISKALVRVL